jgi:hypothetical protein
MIATLLIGNIIKPSSLLCLGIGGSGALLIVFKNFADFGINGAIMVRVLQGICQGGVYPSQNAMWEWGSNYFHHSNKISKNFLPF